MPNPNSSTQQDNDLDSLPAKVREVLRSTEWGDLRQALTARLAGHLGRLAVASNDRDVFVLQGRIRELQHLIGGDWEATVLEAVKPGLDETRIPVGY